MAVGALPIGLIGAAVTYWTSGGAFVWSGVGSAIPYLIVLTCIAELQYQAARGRARPRFRLGAVLVVFTLIAVWCAALGGQRRAFVAASRQRDQLRQELQTLVGQGTVSVGSQTCMLQIKRPDFGDEDLGHVVKALHAADLRVTLLDLADTQVTDAGLRLFDAGPPVDHLCVDRSRVTPVGLRKLPWLSELKSLSFFRLGLTADDVQEIRRLAPRTSLGAP